MRAGAGDIRNPNLIRGAGLLLPEVASTRSLPRYVPWATARPPARCASKPGSPMHAIEKTPYRWDEAAPRAGSSFTGRPCAAWLSCCRCSARTRSRPGWRSKRGQCTRS
ncbi:Hypothetical protein A7982_06271 [Minicystis rosea]|nr:Hypothetical protein A7982_06271 [Minicystis rosea]